MLDAAVDHVAIAVRDIGAAMRLYVDTLGARFLFAGDSEADGFRWAQFTFPAGGKIELVSPLRADSFLTRFLDRHGEGMHHVTLKVPDIAAALAALSTAGIEPINVRIEDPQWKEAFIHPRDANGTLVQIAQAALSDEELARHHLEPHGDREHRHVTLEDLLADLRYGPVGG